MSYFQTVNDQRIDLPNILYYNLTMTTINQENSGIIYGNENYPSLSYLNANMNAPIIENPSEWYASIIRFSIPCISIPIIQFLIQTPVLDINKGIYSFTLRWKNFTSGQTFVNFEPEIFPPSSTIPPINTLTQTFSNYYFLYSYTHLIGMINNTLITATKALNVASGMSFNPPFFHYDSTTALISLYADTSQFDGYLADPVYIWNNFAMKNILEAFPYHSYDYGEINGMDNQFQIYSGQGINVKTIGLITYDIVYQQYISLAYMSYLKTIVIATDMNIISEGSFINNLKSIQNTQYTNILTDFLPDLSIPIAGIASSIFVYNATSLYRMFQFKQKTPLINISLRIFFTDSLNNIYPLLLNKGNSISLKFMFIKKHLIDGQNLLKLNNI